MREKMNTLFLKSGTHRVGMTLDVNEMAKVVKSLRSVRNDNSKWNEIETAWAAMEEVVSTSSLNRSCAKEGFNAVDPFATCSVYEGTKKVYKIW